MLLSYYPAAPAEIAVLPWAAVCPYWQAGIPPASYSPSHRALRPLLFEAWIHCGIPFWRPSPASQSWRGDAAASSESARLFCWGNSCGSCYPPAVQDKCRSTCRHPVPCICTVNRRVQAVVWHSRSMVTYSLLLPPGIPGLPLLGWKLPTHFPGQCTPARAALGIKRCVSTAQSGYANKPFLFPYLFIRN